jgi:hypothetical protein
MIYKTLLEKGNIMKLNLKKINNMITILIIIIMALREE